MVELLINNVERIGWRRNDYLHQAKTLSNETGDHALAEAVAELKQKLETLSN